MTTFDDRDKAFENKFAHDKEIDFKVQAKATKLMARWAAAKMGMTEEDTNTYVTHMVEAHEGSEQVVHHLVADFAKAGLPVTERTVREELDTQLVVARQKLMGGN